jgi:type II secretory pathway pseudopilin PulG
VAVPYPIRTVENMTRARPATPTRAFTLIETIVALVVTSTLLVAGAASFASLLSSNDRVAGPVVLSTVELGLRGKAISNGFALPVADALDRGTVTDIPVTVAPSVPPLGSPSRPEEFTVSVSWAGPSQLVPPVGVTSVGLAVATGEGRCDAVVVRTVVAGEQQGRITGSWVSPNGSCRISPVCLGEVLALPVTAADYPGVDFSDPGCASTW